MKDFIKNYILKILLLNVFIILFFNIKTSYAREQLSFGEYYYAIQGYAYEDKTNDGGELEAIPYVVADLYNEHNQCVATTVTDEKGRYTFADLPAGNYTVGFRWGEVSEEYINKTDYTDTERIKAIQQALKYNGQDYGSYYDEYEGSTEEVQISMIIDVSGSMVDDNKLQQAKGLAKSIVNSLIKEKILGLQIDVEMSLVSFEEEAHVNCELTDDINELNAQIDGMEGGGGTNILNALQVGTGEGIGDFSKENRFVFLLSDGCGGDMDLVKEYLEDLIENQEVGVYMLFIGLQQEWDAINSYYEVTERKQVTAESIANGNTIDEIVTDFNSYIQYILGYEETIEDGMFSDSIEDTFRELNYNNTVVFEAIDMKVDSTNIEKFKKYAKRLTKLAHMKGTSTKICTITSPRI